MNRKLLLALLLIALLFGASVYFFKGGSGGVGGACTPMTMHQKTDYWGIGAVDAGIDMDTHTLGKCGSEWYLDGKATCVGAGQYADPCPGALHCSGDGGTTFGTRTAQMAAVSSAMSGPLC